MSSTTMEMPTRKQSGFPPYHVYHAEANVLSGELQSPLQQKIERQIPVDLRDRRGGHLTRQTEDFSVEGFISFRRGFTRVSGRPGIKQKGWVTLSTSVLEGLNAFEVITADRVVSQVSTRHAYDHGHVPDVTFLGTQFKHLALNGLPVKPFLDLGVCGTRPSGDLPYVTDPRLLAAARDQVKTLLKAKNLPVATREEYDKRLATIEGLKDKSAGRRCDVPTKITCSLIDHIEIEGLDEVKIPGLEVLGNVLVIPDFGTVALAEIEIGVEQDDDPDCRRSTDNGDPQLSNYFHTTMLKMHLGCIGHGVISAGSTKTNGNTRP